MNSQTAWSGLDNRHNATSASHHNLAIDSTTRHSRNQSAPHSTPWDDPRTVEQSCDQESYLSLKDRLATIPTRSKQKRQSLYLDLWTGQHWLGVKLTSPSDNEILKPVSVDTALSVATVGTYRLLNQPLFAKS